MPTPRTLITRIVLGAGLIAAVGAVLLLDHRDVLGSDLGDVHGLLLAMVVLLLVLAGLRELRRLARAAGADLLPVAATLGVVGVTAMPTFGQVIPFLIEDVWALLGGVVAVAFLEQMLRHRISQAFRHLGATLLGVLYLGVGAALLLALRRERGVPVLVLFLAAVKGADIGAYLAGSLLGRHKLIAWLSPGKTWEGLAGGIALAAAAAVAAAGLLDINMTPAAAGTFGALLALAGQFADLCESLLKRAAAIKDSGAVLPAFGGVLDIIDSPLLAAPVAHVLLIFFLP